MLRPVRVDLGNGVPHGKGVVPVIRILTFLILVSTALAGPFTVRFSPRGGCTDLVCCEVAKAKTELFVQSYQLTSPQIADAIVAAFKRGVQVRVVLDRSQESGKASRLGLLRAAGVPVRIDRAHAIHHNKVIVIDGATVVTGSFNFTASAELRNAENCLVVRDQELAREYRADYLKHEEHAK